MTRTATPSGTDEHALISADDLLDWQLCSFFGVRATMASLPLLSQSVQRLSARVHDDDAYYVTCVETLKLLKLDEMTSLRRARLASRARDALHDAITARHDPTTRVRMQRPIDYAYIGEVSAIGARAVNAIRITGADERATAY
ncbi:MAG: hypothetical protein V4713_14110 [Pseudomonadota bacterium]